MNQEDIFKEQLKSVFSDFEAPVPHDGWEKMEQSLNAIVRARIVRRNWYVGSAAATVAILLGSLFFLKSPQTDKPNLPVFTEEVTSGNIKNADKQEVREEVLIAGHTKRKERELPIVSEVLEQTQEKVVVVEQTRKEEPEATEERKAQPEEKRVVQPSQEEIDRLIREFENAGKADIFGGLALKENKSKPLMLALNAKGGLTSSQKTVNSPMTLRSASTARQDDKGDDYYFSNKNNMYADYHNVAYNTGRIADNVAEMEHGQPVSFGITISKTISDRLSVETGLVYTYLFSRAKNTSVDFQNQETQHFHYLGIPVNLNYNFVSIGKLGLYASFGGMIEKDIYGEFRNSGQSVSTELNSTSQGSITKRISQKNPQFSVNAGVGAFYPIYGGFNLYGKIGGSYYFDAKNDYKTIYADKKIVLDLNAGIRFDF